jgi:hypothetical protein
MRLLVKRAFLCEMLERFDILAKGGALPPGSIRTWGGVEYVKAAPGDWRRRVADRGKKLESKTSEKWYSHQLTADELKMFVTDAKTGKANRKAFIGMVETNAAQRIWAVSGKKVTKIMLESDAIRHSYRVDHHNLKDNDMLFLVDVINTAIEIKMSDEKHQNNDVVKISKDIDGQITFTLEIRVGHDGWLSLVTCARKIRRGDASVPQKTPPELTP